MSNRFPIFQAKPKTSSIEIDNADGTALQNLFDVTGSDGALVDNVAVTTDDTADVTLVLVLNDGTSDFTLGEIEIPAGSGTNGTALPVNLLDVDVFPFLQTNGGIPLGPNDILKVKAKSAITATKVVHLTAFGGEY